MFVSPQFFPSAATDSAVWLVMSVKPWLFPVVFLFSISSVSALIFISFACFDFNLFFFFYFLKVASYIVDLKSFFNVSILIRYILSKPTSHKF